MEPKQRKRDAVGNLRELAQQLGVTAGPSASDWKKKDFLIVHRSVEASAQGTPEHRQKATDALALYFGTAPSLPVPPLPLLSPIAGAAPAASPAPEGFRLRSTSCLLTWNALVFANMVTEDLWTAFLAWLGGLTFIFQWTATIERSLKSLDHGRVHLHAFVEFVKAPDWNSLEGFKFFGSLPNCSPTRARGENIQAVKNQGHFYAFAAKIGTVKVGTSGYVPWRDYPVKGYWIDDLWSQHKLDHATYLDYASKIRVGFVTRRRQVEAVVEREKTNDLIAKRALIAQQLAPLQKTFKSSVLFRLQTWANQYTSLLPRFMFLVLRGASRTGKSTLARSLGVELNLGGEPCVQTVQSATAPDLRNYNSEVHKYIVFDNVNDMDFILNYRAMFQSNNDIHALGDSKTGMYAYEVYIWRVPIVITVDMSAKWDPNELWIKDNCFNVFLDGPSWNE